MSETIESFLDKVNECPLVPVLTVKDLQTAGDFAVALQNAGLTIIEVTLRTDCALQAIRRMKKAAPELSVGVGTILSERDLTNARDAGGDFIVTPATSDALLSALQDVTIPVFPGVATPSEALRAYEMGFRYQKFFPAESNGGVKALKSIGDPMPDITFMPTGGINGSSAIDYLSCANVIAVGGSWMVNKQAVDARDWDAVSAHTQAAISALTS